MQRSRHGLAWWLAAVIWTVLTGASLALPGNTDWRYFGTPVAGAATTYRLSDGLPTITEYTDGFPRHVLPELPADLQSRLDVLLPEGQDIRSNPNRLVGTTDAGNTLQFTEAANVWVTFIRESGGYRNSIGYFTYDSNDAPDTPADVQSRILFANTTSEAPMHTAGSTGQTIFLGAVPAGKSLGFLLASNGFSETGRAGPSGSRIPGVRDDIPDSGIFYTLRHLNPEPATDALNVHTVMFKDPVQSSDGYQRIVVAMEETNRANGGDHDLNDVVMVVHVKPRTALANLAELTPLALPTSNDRDRDGVRDIHDEFPDDPLRAYTRAWPDRATWGTLAFEDQWPEQGDYDMNDLVVRYRMYEHLNAQRQVVSLRLDYRLDARGAAHGSGFAVHLPGVPAGTLAQATISRDNGLPETIQAEAGQTDVVMRVFDDSKALIQGGCFYFNTERDCAVQPGKLFSLNLRFTVPTPGFPAPPYNPFIFRSGQRGRETHLPGRPPTALADQSLFGTLDDRSRINGALTYVDQQGLPWALDLPLLWEYPTERNNVIHVYRQMRTWVQSQGTSAKDWYLTDVDPAMRFPSSF